jgi:hypothetical protein
MHYIFCFHEKKIEEITIDVFASCSLGYVLWVRFCEKKIDEITIDVSLPT